MNKLIAEWQIFADENEDENFDFMNWLKWRKSQQQVDQIAQITHEEVFAEIDCTKCANCCKTISPLVQKEEIKRISQRLELSEDEFTEKYLKRDDNNHYVMNALPCPFLRDDKCSIYEIRPEDCRGYPHTNKLGFTIRSFATVANATVCPAVYYILKRMKIRFNWRDGQ